MCFDLWCKLIMQMSAVVCSWRAILFSKAKCIYVCIHILASYAHLAVENQQRAMWSTWSLAIMVILVYIRMLPTTLVQALSVRCVQISYIVNNYLNNANSFILDCCFRLGKSLSLIK